MRVLVIYCHPVETSFQAALHQEVVTNLKAAGHTVDDCDLYAESFNPVMSRQERLGYHDVPSNQAPMQAYIDNDIVPANALGMRTILFRTGRHITQQPRSFTELPDAELRTVEELRAALLALTGRLAIS